MELCRTIHSHAQDLTTPRPPLNIFWLLTVMRYVGYIIGLMTHYNHIRIYIVFVAYFIPSHFLYSAWIGASDSRLPRATTISTGKPIDYLFGHGWLPNRTTFNCYLMLWPLF